MFMVIIDYLASSIGINEKSPPFNFALFIMFLVNGAFLRSFTKLFLLLSISNVVFVTLTSFVVANVR